MPVIVNLQVNPASIAGVNRAISSVNRQVTGGRGPKPFGSTPAQQRLISAGAQRGFNPGQVAQIYQQNQALTASKSFNRMLSNLFPQSKQSGLSNSVSRVIRAFGGSSATSSLVGAALRLGSSFGVVVTGLLAYGAAMKSATDSILEFRRTALMTGANSAGSAGFANRLGAETVNSIVDAIGSGGVAEAIARQAGVNVAHDPLGKARQDNAAKVIELIDKLRAMPGGQKAARDLSRLTGKAEIAELTALNDEQWKRVKAISAESAVSGKSQEAAKGFGTAWENLMQIVSGAFREYLAPSISMVTPVINQITDAFRSAMPILKIGGQGVAAGFFLLSKVIQGISFLIQKLFDGINAVAGKFGLNFGGPSGGDSGGLTNSIDNLKNSLDRNTQAAYENTRAINGREMLGGGGQSRSALPTSAGHAGIATARDYANAFGG